VVVSLVNTFTNYRHVKGSKPKKFNQVSKLTHRLSVFLASMTLDLQHLVTNVVH
jgi:hypothetical protein